MYKLKTDPDYLRSLAQWRVAMKDYVDKKVREATSTEGSPSQRPTTQSTMEEEVDTDRLRVWD